MSGPKLAVVSAAPRLYGLLAEFATVEQLLAAAAAVREAGYTRFDAHAPIPVHGIDEAMGIRMSKLPWVVALGGAAGCAAGLTMQWWMNAFDYAFKVSGKPFFALPPAIPVTFEVTVLLGSLGAVLGLLAAAGFPRLHHPLLSSARFRRATSDRFFISIEAGDPAFERTRTEALLASLGSTHIEEVADES